MTKNSDFKNLVRARMQTTGENYTSARSAILRTVSAPDPSRSAEPATDRATEAFRTKTLRAFMPADTLTAIPMKRKALVVILLEILPAFASDRIYTEKEVNSILGSFHPDFARLRRELIDYRYLARNSHTGRYWVNEEWPPRRGRHMQETEGLEAFRR